MHTRAVRIALGIGAAALVAGVAAQLQRLFTEGPKYDVLSRVGDLEMRRYGPRVIARTPLSGLDQQAKNEGFRVLAGYIFGGNVGGQRIAMTTPVETDPAAGARIAMTTPVETTTGDGQLYMTFTMPQEHTLQTLPRPNDSRVELVEVPGRVTAALRFRGRPSPAEFEAKQVELLRAVRAAGLQAVGAPVTAQYDPPWVLGLLRRNEVLVAVEEPSTTR